MYVSKEIREIRGRKEKEGKNQGYLVDREEAY